MVPVIAVPNSPRSFLLLCTLVYLSVSVGVIVLPDRQVAQKLDSLYLMSNDRESVRMASMLSNVHEKQTVNYSLDCYTLQSSSQNSQHYHRMGCSTATKVKIESMIRTRSALLFQNYFLFWKEDDIKFTSQNVFGKQLSCGRSCHVVTHTEIVEALDPLWTPGLSSSPKTLMVLAILQP